MSHKNILKNTRQRYCTSYICKEASSTLSGHAGPKNISDFKIKASGTGSGGFYIGRYEARTGTERSGSTNAITKVTTKASDYVYNYISQTKASELARNMYQNAITFESDLINSYAWDTATLFLQTFGNNSKYSIKNSVNTTLASTGTNNQSTKDVQCNVCDMASNLIEYTTEENNSTSPNVYRGGRYDISGEYTTLYRNILTDEAYVQIGFRPILYL